jgi:DNA-binding Lrp family transcriptional regulator
MTLTLSWGGLAMKAYVLISARAGKSREVVSKVKQLDAVKSVNACWGRPDVFALVEVKNQIELTDAVLAKIQQIEGVESTDTHIVIE